MALTDRELLDLIRQLRALQAERATAAAALRDVDDRIAAAMNTLRLELPAGAAELVVGSGRAV